VRRKLTFGLYALEPERKLGPLLNTFCEWLGAELEADVDVDETSDYETLAHRVRAKAIDIAWLPPIVLLRTWDDIVPVVAIQRGGPTVNDEIRGFETALIVREDSPLKRLSDLKDGRAAWVDEWSAAGYVIPRLRLRLDGMDLAVMFREEHFYGTHSAAVRAVLDGEADVAGTYCQRDPETGKVVDGPWSQIEGARVRVLTTFGEIPADVFAVTPGVPEDMRGRLLESLVKAAKEDDKRGMIKQLFGADGFGPVAIDSYAGLRSALSLANKTENWDDMSKV
jgi:phosphate/phosphite/phosphonate ABC transporter binding protein